jgi:hypothetical protein
MAGSADQAGFAIEGVSEKFRQLAQQQTGRRASGGGRESDLFKDLQEQNRLLDEETQRVRDLNGEFDESAWLVRDLSGRFDLLDPGRLRELADETRRVEENRRRIAGQQQREQEAAANKAAANATARRERSAADGGGGSAGSITVNVNPTIHRRPAARLRAP